MIKRKNDLKRADEYLEKYNESYQRAEKELKKKGDSIKAETVLSLIDSSGYLFKSEALRLRYEIGKLRKYLFAAGFLSGCVLVASFIILKNSYGIL